MTFVDALAVFKTRVANNPALKPRTKEYCAYRISALLKSWPGLAEKDVSRIANFLSKLFRSGLTRVFIGTFA
jgi:hypothetical protein